MDGQDEGDGGILLGCEPPASRFACRVPLLLTQKGEVGLPRPLVASHSHPDPLPSRERGEIPRCASNDVGLGGEAVLFLGFVGDVGGGHAY